MLVSKNGVPKKSTADTKQAAAPKAADKEKAVMIGARVHPKLQYGLRLLARVQGGTIAEALEWAINLAMRSTGIGAGVEATRLNKVVDKVWAQSSTPRRIYVLFQSAPELLDFDERGAWNLVRRCPDMWTTTYFKMSEDPESDPPGMPCTVLGTKEDHDSAFDETEPKFDLIERHWTVISHTGVLLARAGEIGETYTFKEITSGEALERAGIESPF